MATMTRWSAQGDACPQRVEKAYHMHTSRGHTVTWGGWRMPGRGVPTSEGFSRRAPSVMIERGSLPHDEGGTICRVVALDRDVRGLTALPMTDAISPTKAWKSVRNCG